MAFKYFSINNNEADAQAAYELISIITAVYWDAMNECKNLLINIAPGSTILRWDFDNTRTNPSYAVIKTPEGIILAFAGTVNAEQWIQQFNNINPVFVPAWGMYLHNFWWTSWQTMRTDIANAINGDYPMNNLLATGHSLGAGMSALAGINFNEPTQPQHTWIANFAQPRIGSRETTSTFPHVWARYYEHGDLVTELPYNSMQYTGRFLPGMQNSAPVFLWWHHGQGISLERDGHFENNPLPRIAPLIQPLNAVITGLDHPIGSYEQNLWDACGVAGVQQNVSNLREINLRIKALPNPQGTNLILPPNAYINLPALNQQVAPNIEPPPVTLGNLAAVQEVFSDVRTTQGSTGASNNNIFEFEGNMATQFWKISLFINNSKYGRIESHVWNKAGATVSQAKTQAERLIEYRAACLGSTAGPDFAVKNLGTPMIEFTRISDALQPRISQLYKNSGQPYFGFGSGSSADFFATALSMRLIGQMIVAPNTVSNSNLLLVGQMDTAVTAGVFNPSISAGGSRSIGVAIQNYLQFLQDPANNLGYMGTDTTQPNNPVAPSAQNATTGVITCTVPGHGYLNLAKVHLERCNAQGFNGIHSIVNVTTNTFDLADPYEVGVAIPTRGLCRQIQTGAHSPAQAGDNQRLLQFYQYQPALGGAAAVPINVSKKNPGRENLAISFPRRKKKAK